MSGVEHLGVQHERSPIPIREAETTYVPAGAIKIGVEGRTLQAEAIELALRLGTDLPAEQVEERVRFSQMGASGMQADGGPSLHILSAAAGAEYLRFDCFRDIPHYHYLDPGKTNTIVNFDRFANGDPLEWALERISHSLSDMLRAVGADDLVDALEPAIVAAAVPEVRRLAQAIIS